MARQLPKNVRQIGNVSDTPKIYVEDYVDTFFTQLCEKAGEEPVGAFLIGDFQKSEEEEYVYIYGAIQMHKLATEGADFVLDDETWKRAYEDCKQYFEDGEMLGWFVARPGAVLKLEKNIVKLHRKSFPKKNTVFILKDSTEKEELYYVHKFNDLLPVGGHYTYYEKNPCMQNYMISTRKKNGATPMEAVEDQAAKDFRGIARLREERQRQKKAARLMYSFSACLVLIVIIMGVVTFSNFDKMRSVQESLNYLTGAASAGDSGGGKKGAQGSGENGQAVEVNGTVTAVLDSEGNSSDPSGAAGKDKDEKDQADSSAGNGNSSEADSDDGTDSTGLGGISSNGTGSGGADGAGSGGIGSGGAGSGGADGAGSGGTGGAASGSEGGGASTGQGSESPGENGSDGIYIVEKGDTLAMISRKIYGDISHVEAICKMNGLEDGNLIFVGQKLLLP